MTKFSDTCKALRKSVKADLPYISGNITLGPNEYGVFYQGPKGLGMLNLSTATTADLEALSDACEPASFGVGGQDVLDTSYRKAGKMDSARFAAQFSPVNHNLVDIIKQDLLKDGDQRGVGLELYKLNVYGPGSFFKAHIDTPRSENMFGSLVVILPTPHEGGSLIFRHNNNEWTFDSADAVKLPNDTEDANSAPTDLRAAFTAFYSDVEHEVTPVISGYRVTLTYNLYFNNDTPEGPSETINIRTQSPATLAIRDHLNDLLSNRSFLKSGGKIGFNLVHKYPVHRSTNLSTLTKLLKGPDARILLACRSLGLETSLQVFYTFDSGPTIERYVTQKAIDGQDFDYIDEESWPETQENLEKHCGAKMVMDAKLEMAGEVKGGVKRKKNDPDVSEVYWVNPEVKNATNVESAYVAYGNEAALGYLYGDVAIVAEVGKAGQRNMKRRR